MLFKLLSCFFVCMLSSGCKLQQSKQEIKTIIGSDDRMLLTDAVSLAAVGAISVNGNKVCTGFLVAKDLVASALHCIPATNGILFANIQFHLNAQSPIEITSIANANVNTDIVFLRLKTSLAATPFHISEYAQKDTPLSIVSFDKSTDKMLIAKNCTINSYKPSFFFTHTCDTLPGASGSPVLQNGVVVGMHMGALRQEKLNIAVEAKILKDGDLRGSEYFKLKSIILESSAVDVGPGVDVIFLDIEAAAAMLEQCRTGKHKNAFMCQAAQDYLSQHSQSTKQDSQSNLAINDTKNPKDCSTQESSAAPQPPVFKATSRGGFALADGSDASGKSKTWHPGSIVRIRFINGTETERKQVMSLIGQWPVNLKFQQVSTGYAEIRIRLPVGQQDGSWSKIGTDAKSVNQNEHTLQLGWMTNDTILHEFGHALGFIHEHLSPGSSINWNHAAVDKKYKGPPNNWSQEKINLNIYNHPPSRNHTNFDPQSIMIYSYTADLTNDRTSATRGETLSATDKAFASTLYPSSIVMGASENEMCGGFAGIACNESFYRYASDDTPTVLVCKTTQPGIDTMGNCKPM